MFVASPARPAPGSFLSVLSCPPHPPYFRIMADEFNPSPRLADRLEAMDKELNAWALNTKQALIKSVVSLNLREKARVLTSTLSAELKERGVSGSKRTAILREAKPLAKGIGYNLRYTKEGDLEKIAFVFARKGIWLEHGVGRGRPIGSQAAQSLARPWLGPTLNSALPELATTLAAEYADIAAFELRLLIPGIIDTKITR